MACDSKKSNTNATCEFDTYKANVVHAINYFLNGVDNSNAEYINALQNPMSSGLFNFTINIESKYKYNGFDVLKTGSFCIHDS